MRAVIFQPHTAFLGMAFSLVCSEGCVIMVRQPALGIGIENSTKKKPNLLIGKLIAKLGEFLCPSVTKRTHIMFFPRIVLIK